MDNNDKIGSISLIPYWIGKFSYHFRMWYKRKYPRNCTWGFEININDDIRFNRHDYI